MFFIERHYIYKLHYLFLNAKNISPSRKPFWKTSQQKDKEQPRVQWILSQKSLMAENLTWRQPKNLSEHFQRRILVSSETIPLTMMNNGVDPSISQSVSIDNPFTWRPIGAISVCQALCHLPENGLCAKPHKVGSLGLRTFSKLFHIPPGLWHWFKTPKPRKQAAIW